MGSMHFLGIVDNTFREFILSQAPPAVRRCHRACPYVLRQPLGTKKLHSYVKVDKDNHAKFTLANEKLHQKLKWRKMPHALRPQTAFQG